DHRHRIGSRVIKDSEIRLTMAKCISPGGWFKRRASMRGASRNCLGIVTGLVAVCLILVAPGASASSSLVIVDDRNGSEGFPALVLDAATQPHLLWLDWESGGIQSATFDRASGRLVHVQLI